MVIGADLMCGLRQQVQHRRPRLLLVLIVRGVEGRPDHRPAEGMHDAQTAAVPQRLPSAEMNGGLGCRRTVEADYHGPAHRKTSTIASMLSDRRYRLPLRNTG